MNKHHFQLNSEPLKILIKYTDPPNLKWQQKFTDCSMNLFSYIRIATYPNSAPLD